MSLQTKDVNVIKKVGIEILTKELGPVSTAYFLRQFDMGKGDYTQEREELLADVNTMNEFKSQLNKYKK
jgi:hypothetical protein